MARICYFVLLLLIVFLSPQVGAQEIISDDDVNRVAERLYCPTCTNQALAVCATQTCQQWREEVRRQLSAGNSEEEIIANFVRLYGTEVLGVPGDSTGRVLTYIPVVFVILIASLIILRNRHNEKNV